MKRLRQADGVSLVEVVVALFILAIISLVFLPVLASSLTMAANNSTRTTANEFARDVIEQARATNGVCTAVTALRSPSSITDPRGITLAATVTTTNCPAAFTATTSATITVNVIIKRTDTAETMATASTLVLVTSN